VAAPRASLIDNTMVCFAVIGFGEYCSAFAFVFSISVFTLAPFPSIRSRRSTGVVSRFEQNFGANPASRVEPGREAPREESGPVPQNPADPDIRRSETEQVRLPGADDV